MSVEDQGDNTVVATNPQELVVKEEDQSPDDAETVESSNVEEESKVVEEILPTVSSPPDISRDTLDGAMDVRSWFGSLPAERRAVALGFSDDGFFLNTVLVKAPWSTAPETRGSHVGEYRTVSTKFYGHTRTTY
jgi:hypothetical protein